jgi:hypothetical protein
MVYLLTLFLVPKGPIDWTIFLLASGNKKERSRKLGILFAFWWQGWKERNCRIFEDKHQSPLQVPALLQDHLSCLYLARDVPS